MIVAYTFVKWNTEPKQSSQELSLNVESVISSFAELMLNNERGDATLQPLTVMPYIFTSIAVDTKSLWATIMIG